MKTHATFSELLQGYFTNWLMRQRNASPNTVASHRDTFRLLLGFAQRILRKPPTTLAAALELKEKAMAKTQPLNRRPGRYRPGDRLLAFLQSL